MLKVAYENLAVSNSPYFAELEDAALRVIRGGWYILGSQVSSFESEFAKYIGSKHCIGVANGLDALTLSIEALDLPKPADILVASNTYIATILAIVRAGCNPILVEPDVATFNIDPEKLKLAITSNTRAVCVTHMFGKSCRMDEICRFSDDYGLKLIEDCAQSHGAKFKGTMTGTFGDTGCFSFYPTKNLGALGDAGAIVTCNDELAERLRHTRNYGSRIKYFNEYIGVNSRLDEMQAALLRVKLKHLDQMNERKRQLAKIYFDELPNWLHLPSINDDEFDVHHIFSVRCSTRDNLRKWLMERGVQTEIHYPIAPNKQRALQGFNLGDFPISERMHNEQLSLPISFCHTDQEIQYVAEMITSFKE